MADVHPTAIVSPEAEFASDVQIGPYCIVGSSVVIGSGTRLMGHAVVDGHTRIGSDCTLYPFCSVGLQTQDLKFREGNVSHVEIGDRTTIREYVTIHAATDHGDVTRVGSDCHIMAYAHIAHDCVVGNEVIIANCGTLAGHVVLEDQVILGGLSAVHQFVKLGRLSIVGGCSKVTQDVPPFMMADGHPLRIPAVNSIGLKRRGISEESQRHLKQAHRILYRQDLSTSHALERLATEVEQVEEIQQLIRFISSSERGIVK